MSHLLCLIDLLVILVIYNCLTLVTSHGRLFQPPGRSTAWRYDFDTPPNYNDHQVFCGGYSRQWSTNKGKCGPCGDAYDLPQPRENENGGKYGTGKVVKKYKESQKVTIGVELTANHRGFFEFRLCPLNAPGKTPETDDCFEKNLLLQGNGNGARYYVGEGSRKMYPKYQLPEGLTCIQCVLQWRYVAGNNWGNCPNGTGMVGCGPQEEFRSCADITIVASNGFVDDKPAYPAGFGNTTAEPTDIPEYSYGGHITAVTIAVMLAVFFALTLLVYYFWSEGRISDFFVRRKNTWKTRFPPSLIITSLKNVNLFPSLNKGSKVVSPQLQTHPFVPTTSVVPPPIPPRRNKTSSQQGARPTGISISSPVSVSINGVQVSTLMSSGDEASPNSHGSVA